MPCLPGSCHPPDPFADEYRVPDIREVGTTAAQVQFVGGATVGLASAGASAGIEGTIELMTIARIGVRGTLQLDVLHAAAAPHVFAARVGPALHLLPYRRVDLSLFVEGGAAYASPPGSGSGKHLVPTLSPGLELELWVTSTWFVAYQGQLDWLAIGDGRYLRATSVASLGLGF